MTFHHQLQGNGQIDLAVDSRIRQLRLDRAEAGDRYHNAQLDDYQMGQRHRLMRLPGCCLTLRARFSGGVGEMVGTAGFGFWNAPAPGNMALPQAVWFFFASPPNDLPLNANGIGRGWFASTIDAGSWRAKRLIPLAPLALVANQFGALRRRIMPPIMAQLGIAFRPISATMTDWHTYQIEWHQNGCKFLIDDRLLLETPHAPRGPLGFVCWIDNQYAIVTTRGKVRFGVLSIPAEQYLQVDSVTISTC